MSKGNRNREKRCNTATVIPQYTSQLRREFGFCLPDTPDNRDLVRMLTGQSPEAFVNGDGMLDSLYAEETNERKTAIPQASPCKPL